LWGVDPAAGGVARTFERPGGRFERISTNAIENASFDRIFALKIGKLFRAAAARGSAGGPPIGGLARLQP
jgi:hypothetical protein